MRVKAVDIYIFVGFFLISLSIFRGFDGTVWENVLLYIGYLFIMIPSYLGLLVKGRVRLVRKVCFIALIWILMSFGVLTHSMNAGKRIEVLLSYFIIVSLMVNSNEIIREPYQLGICSYAILASLISGFLLCLVMGIPWFSVPTEGLSYAINFGMGHKNYAGGAALAALIGIYVSASAKNKPRHKALMLISVILIIISASRTVWIMALTALFIAKSRHIISFVHKHKLLFFGVAVAVLIFGIYFMQFISQSFYFRYQGLLDYFEKYSADWRLFLFGSADVVYSEERTYQLNLISAFGGGTGTTEMGVLNVLVKSGFIGLLSYLLYFIVYLKNIEKTKSEKVFQLGLLVLAPMIVSSFAEPFLVNIKLIYTVFTWCAMSYLIQYSGNCWEGNNK